MIARKKSQTKKFETTTKFKAGGGGPLEWFQCSKRTLKTKSVFNCLYLLF